MRLVGIARIDIDRDHLEALAPERPLERVERRHLLAARDAPGRPQIEQHGASAPIRQSALGAGQVVKPDVRHPQRAFGDRHRGHLSARERADAFGDLERGPAPGIARIAQEAANPVYPRQAGERSGDDRPGDQGQPARVGRRIVLSGWAVTVGSILLRV